MPAPDLKAGLIRKDIKNLLDQIHAPDFPYKEFREEEAPPAQPRWPLLIAIANHPAFRHLSADRAFDPPTDFFRQYGGTKSGGGSGPAPQPDTAIRDMLRRVAKSAA